MIIFINVDVLNVEVDNIILSIFIVQKYDSICRFVLGLFKK